MFSGERLRFFTFALAPCVLLLTPNLPPYNVTFTEFNATKPVPLTGKLSPNTLLNNTERLFENEIKGPEGFAVLNGELYTTLHGGYVARIKNDKLEPVKKFGEPCEHWWQEDKCGRPLGIAATNDGHLVVADAYYGIFKYNVKFGNVTELVSRNAVIEGEKPKIFNSVAVASDGSVYWTDSSCQFPLYDGLYTFLADPSGRLMKYDAKTKKNSILLDKLYFANGVALSPNEDFVIVAETRTGRIRRVYLKGSKKLQSDTFIDGLPGYPDNLRPSGKGGFYVSLIADRSSVGEYFLNRPLVRKALARILGLLDWSFKVMDSAFPADYIKRLIHFTGHFEMISAFQPVRATFVEVDANGNVVASYHGVDGSVTAISDVVVHEDSLYLGSPYNTYLGRIKLSQFRGKL